MTHKIRYKSYVVEYHKELNSVIVLVAAVYLIGF